MYLEFLNFKNQLIMKKIIFLFGLALILNSCAQQNVANSTTITNQDEKSMAVSKLMKGYVDNNFDGSRERRIERERNL